MSTVIFVQDVPAIVFMLLAGLSACLTVLLAHNMIVRSLQRDIRREVDRQRVRAMEFRRIDARHWPRSA